MFFITGAYDLQTPAHGMVVTLRMGREERIEAVLPGSAPRLVTLRAFDVGGRLSAIFEERAFMWLHTGVPTTEPAVYIGPYPYSDYHLFELTERRQPFPHSDAETWKTLTTHDWALIRTAVLDARNLYVEEPIRQRLLDIAAIAKERSAT